MSPTASRPWLLLAGVASLLIAAAVGIYNVLLLDVLAQPEQLDPALAEKLIRAGRWISAFALAWACSKFLFAVHDARREWRHLAAAACIVALATFGINKLNEFSMHKAIDSLPAQTVHRAFQLAFYRHLLTTGEVRDQDIRLTVPAVAPVDQLMIAGFGLAAFSDRITGPASAAYTSYGIKRMAAQRGMVMADWPAIKGKIDELDRGTRLLAEGSRLFDEKYDMYIAASGKATGGSFFGSTYASQIKLMTGGVSVDPGASKEQFAEALASQSTITDYREGAKRYLQRDTYVAQIQEANNRILFDSKKGHVIRVKDLPRPFSQEVVMPWFDAKASEILRDLMPSEATIKSQPFGVAVATSVLAPPFVIALSIVSIVLNSVSGILYLLIACLPAGIRRYAVHIAFPMAIASLVTLIALAPLCFPGTGFEVAERSAIEAHPVVSYLSKFMSLEARLLAVVK